MTRVLTGRNPLSTRGTPLLSAFRDLIASLSAGDRHSPIPAREEFMVTITSFTEGKCVWCCQTGEGVHVSFQDGLNGFLCKRDFWSALKARCEQGKVASEPPTAKKP